MAYTTDTLRIALEVPGKYGFKIWIYDTEDATGTVDTAAYISDAVKKGMNKGDLLIRRTWTSLPTRATGMQTAAGSAPVLASGGFHWVLGIATTGTADVTDVTALAVTNTD